MQQNVLKKRRKSETWELSLSLNLSFPNSKASLPYFRLQTVFYSSKNANSVNSSHLKSIPTFLNRNVTFRLTVPPRISLRMFVHLKYIPELPTTKKANAEEKDLWISWWDFSEAVPRHIAADQPRPRCRCCGRVVRPRPNKHQLYFVSSTSAWRHSSVTSKQNHLWFFFFSEDQRDYRCQAVFLPQSSSPQGALMYVCFHD